MVCIAQFYTWEQQEILILRCILCQADSNVTDPQVAADLKKKRTFRTFSYRGVELDKLLDLGNDEVPPPPIPISLQI